MGGAAVRSHLSRASSIGDAHGAGRVAANNPSAVQGAIARSRESTPRNSLASLSRDERLVWSGRSLSGLLENPAVPGLAPGQLDRAPDARDKQRDNAAIPMLCERLVGSAEGHPRFLERPATTAKVAERDEDPRAVHRGDVVIDEPLIRDRAHRPLRYEPHGLEPCWLLGRSGSFIPFVP
jgi:hypothetical protein